MLNTINTTIAGNAGRDPELKYTAAGKPWVSLNVAVTPRVKDGDGWKDGVTTWVTVKCFGPMAENVAESITKGMRVIASGSLSLVTFTGRDGNPKTSLELLADDIGPSLTRSSVHLAAREPVL